MKKAIYLLSALFIFGTISAQDSTFTKKVTTTTKKTERVFKKKRHAPVMTVTTEDPLPANGTIDKTADPVRREETEVKVDVKINDPAKD